MFFLRFREHLSVRALDLHFAPKGSNDFRRRSNRGIPITGSSPERNAVWIASGGASGPQWTGQLIHLGVRRRGNVVIVTHEAVYQPPREPTGESARHHCLGEPVGCKRILVQRRRTRFRRSQQHRADLDRLCPCLHCGNNVFPAGDTSGCDQRQIADIANVPQEDLQSCCSWLLRDLMRRAVPACERALDAEGVSATGVRERSLSCIGDRDDDTASRSLQLLDCGAIRAAERERHDGYRILEQKRDLLLPSIAVGGVRLGNRAVIPVSLRLSCTAVGLHVPRPVHVPGSGSGRNKEIDAEGRRRRPAHTCDLFGDPGNGLVPGGEKPGATRFGSRDHQFRSRWAAGPRGGK